MEERDDSARPDGEDDFLAHARRRPRSTVVELLDFLRRTRAYWLAPIVLTLLMLAVLLALSATPAAPFVYTLF